MKRNFLTWSTILAVALFLVSVPASARDHGNGNGKGNPHNSHWQDDDDDHGHHGNGKHHDDDRWEQRGNWEYQRYDGDRRPPGWTKGKKTGWGNCDLPPGQAKKYGCSTYTYQGRQYYWYRDNDGSIVIRRPHISAHAGISIE